MRRGMSKCPKCHGFFPALVPVRDGSDVLVCAICRKDIAFQARQWRNERLKEQQRKESAA